MTTDAEQRLIERMQDLVPEPPHRLQQPPVRGGAAQTSAAPSAHDLMRRRQTDGPPRRRPWLPALAAAVVMAVAVGVAAAWPHGDRQAPSATGAPPRATPVARSLPFAIPAGAPLRVAEAVVEKTPGIVEATLRARTGHYALRLTLGYGSYAEAGDPHDLAQLRPTTVGGNPGLAGTVDGVTTVLWTYGHRKVAQLVVRKGRVGPAAVEGIAARVRFDRTTPIAVPVRVPSAPRGTRLTFAMSNYPITAHGSSDWYFAAVYQPRGDEGGYALAAYPARFRTRYVESEPGTPAVCLPAPHSASTLLCARAVDSTPLSASVRRTLTTLAGRLVLARHPGQRSSWFEARTALP